MRLRQAIKIYFQAPGRKTTEERAYKKMRRAARRARLYFRRRQDNWKLTHRFAKPRVDFADVRDNPMYDPPDPEPPEVTAAVEEAKRILERLGP